MRRLVGVKYFLGGLSQKVFTTILLVSPELSV
jgi:hypothetical protein